MAPDASTRGARPVRITESTSSTVAAPERAWANPMAVARFIRNILPASARHRPTRAWEGRGAQTGEGIADDLRGPRRSEEHTSELQSLMRISYAVFCLIKKKKHMLNEQMKSTHT